MKILIKEYQLKKILNNIISESEGVLGIGGFPQIRNFTLKDNPTTISYTASVKNKFYNPNIKISEKNNPTKNSIVIVFHKKPIENYYKVEFVALDSLNNRLGKLYVNALDGDIDQKLDRDEIHIIDSTDYFIERTPTIENFEKFKNIVIDYMKKYDPKFEM